MNSVNVIVTHSIAKNIGKQSMYMVVWGACKQSIRCFSFFFPHDFNPYNYCIFVFLGLIRHFLFVYLKSVYTNLIKIYNEILLGYKYMTSCNVSLKTTIILWYFFFDIQEF